MTPEQLDQRQQLETELASLREELVQAGADVAKQSNHHKADSAKGAHLTEVAEQRYQQVQQAIDGIVSRLAELPRY